MELAQKNRMLLTFHSPEWEGRRRGLFSDSKQLSHLPVFKSFSGDVRLHPVAINHELRNGPLARALDYFFSRAGGLFNVDLLVGNVVLGKPALCDMAIAAPRSGIDG